MKSLICILLIILNINGFGQFNQAKVSIGLGYRGNPQIIKAGTRVTNIVLQRIHTDTKKFYTANSLNLNLVVPLNEHNWYIEFANYVRYNHFKYEMVLDIPTILDTDETLNFKSDHFLDIFKKFSLDKKKNKSFKLGLGYGFMNTNTNYRWRFNTGVKDINGNWIYDENTATLGFWCKRFILGYCYKKIDFSFIAHESHDISHPNSYTWWIEANVAYNLNLFKKKK